MRIGPFEIVDDPALRKISISGGGNPTHFGDGYLSLGLAMRAVHGALELLGVGPSLGPVEAMLVLPHARFCQFREALVADCQPGAGLFKGHRRKTVDPNRLVIMFGGVTIASDLAANTVDLSNLRCPSRPPVLGAA